MSNRDALMVALQWYADEAKALARFKASHNGEAMLASVTVLALDNGRRAEEALATGEAVVTIDTRDIDPYESIEDQGGPRFITFTAADVLKLLREKTVDDAMVERYCVAAFGDLGWPHDFTPEALASNRAEIRRNLIATLDNTNG